MKTMEDILTKQLSPALFCSPTIGATALRSMTFPPQKDRKSPKASNGCDHHDDVLIALSLGGNEDAFEQLVKRYSSRVFALISKFFGSAEVIEEIALEVFAKAFSSLASYRRTISLERWLAKITFKICYEELRRSRRRGGSRLTAITDEEAAWLDSKLAGGSFEIHLGEGEHDRAAEILDKLLSALSPETRLILVLRHDEKLSPGAIAQLMGWSELKTKIRAFRARHELRRAISRWSSTFRLPKTSLNSELAGGLGAEG